MNDTSSDIPDEETKSSRGGDYQKIPEDTSPESLSDGIFTIKISEDMALRNALRSGLVEAQGSDTEKMPLYVSWPHWLEDGIVCLFAKDLHYLLNKTVQDTAISFGKTFKIEVENSVPDTIIEEQKGGMKSPAHPGNDTENVESEIETSVEAEQETIIEVPETETSEEFVQEAIDEKPEDEFSSQTEQRRRSRS